MPFFLWICFILFCFFPIVLQSQIIGSSEVGESVPKEVGPASVSAGVVSGDVNLFTGQFQASYPLGSVSTPGGLSYTVSLAYSSSYAGGTHVPSSSGIPYGEGWQLSIPVISISTDDYHKYAMDWHELDSTKTFTSSELSEEGKIHWLSPSLSAPGYSGRLTHLYDTEDESVFTLQHFTSYVEARFNGQVWTVILPDGTKVLYDVIHHHYRNPLNQRINVDPETGEDLQTGEYLSNVVLPQDEVLSWYPSRMLHPNHPSGEMVLFRYQSYGHRNYYKQYLQPYLKEHLQNEIIGSHTVTAPWLEGEGSIENVFPNFEVASDVFLLSVEAISEHVVTQKVVLEHGSMSTAGALNMMDLSDPTVGRQDSLYSYQSVYYAGSTDSSSFMGTYHPPTNLGSGFSSWNRYHHLKHDDVQVFSGGIINEPNAKNPYHGQLSGTLPDNYYRSPVSGSTVSFDHSFLESPRIGGNIFGQRPDFPTGDLYELRMVIQNNNIINGNPQGGLATYDIQVVSGSYVGEVNNPDAGPYDATPDASAWQRSRSKVLYGTTDDAIKWSSVGKSPTDPTKTYTVTSNYFTLTNLPKAFNGFHIQVGPGQAAMDYSADYLEVGYSSGNSVVPSSYTTYHNELFRSQTPSRPNGTLWPGKYIKSGDRLPNSFGIGMPMDMMRHFYAGLDHYDATDDYTADRYGFWWNHHPLASPPTSNNMWDNRPTALDDEVSLLACELVRYTKNPYMLQGVKTYVLNGETKDSESLEGYVLASAYDLDYEITQDYLLDNKEYGVGELESTYGVRDVVLLKEISSLPTDPSRSHAGFVYDAEKVPTTHFEYTLMNNPLYQAETRSNRHIYALSSITDQLGGTKRISYYPLTVFSANEITPSRWKANYVAPGVANLTTSGVTNQRRQMAGTTLLAVESILIDGGIEDTVALEKRYVYEHPVSLVRTLPLDGNHFHGASIDESTGFSTVTVYEPKITGSDSSAYSVHYFHDGETESGLLFGRPYRVTHYSGEGMPIAQEDTEYEVAKAYAHYMDRPGNPCISDYEDYYNPSSCGGSIAKHPSELLDISLGLGEMRYYEDRYSSVMDEKTKAAYFTPITRSITTDFEAKQQQEQQPSLLTPSGVLIPIVSGKGIASSKGIQHDVLSPEATEGGSGGKGSVSQSIRPGSGGYTSVEVPGKGSGKGSISTTPVNLHGCHPSDLIQYHSGNRDNWPDRTGTSNGYRLRGMEQVSEHSYYDANERGMSTSEGYKYVLNDFSSDSVYTYYHPSWMPYKVKSWSPQVPGAYSEQEYFYYYDLPKLTQHNGYGVDGAYISFRDQNRSLPYEHRTTVVAAGQDPIVSSTYFIYHTRWSDTTYYDRDTVYVTGGSGVAPSGTDSLISLGCFAISNPDGGSVPTPPAGFYHLVQGGIDFYCPCEDELSAGCSPTQQGTNIHSGDFPSDASGSNNREILGLGQGLLRLSEVITQIDTVWIDKSEYLNESNILSLGGDGDCVGKCDKRPILRFSTQGNPDAGLWNGYKAPLFPYETLTLRTIDKYHLSGWVLEERDVEDVIHRYTYRDKVLHWNVNIQNPTLSYNSIEYRDIGRPLSSSIDDGTTVVTTEYKYSVGGLTLDSVVGPTGIVGHYAYDEYGRLHATYRNGVPLSLSRYSHWENDKSQSYEERTMMNYVETASFLLEGDSSAQVARAYVTPRGEEYGVMAQISPNAYTGALGSSMVYKGLTKYDNWNRVEKVYKSFVYEDALGQAAFVRRTNLDDASYPQEYASYRYEDHQKSRTLQTASFGLDIEGDHAGKMRYTMITGKRLSQELGLTSQERNELMPLAKCKYLFYRTSTEDADGKEVISYSNALGQQVGSKTWINKDLDEYAATLFVYGSHGQVEKVINPKKQATTYQYNHLGHLVEEKTVDGGTKRWMYNKRGMVVLSMEERHRTNYYNTSVEKPTYTYYEYDKMGRPLAQYGAELTIPTMSYPLGDPLGNRDTLYAPLYVGGLQDNTNNFQIPYSNRHTYSWSYCHGDCDNNGGVLGQQYRLEDFLTNRTLQKRMVYDALPTTDNLYQISHPNARVFIDNDENNGLGKIVATASYHPDHSDPILIKYYNYDSLGQVRWMLQQMDVEQGIDQSNPGYIVKHDYPLYDLKGRALKENIYVNADSHLDIQHAHTYDNWDVLRGIYLNYKDVAYDSLSSKGNLVAHYDYDITNSKITELNYYAALKQPDGSYVGGHEVDQTSYHYDMRERLVRIQSILTRQEMYYDDEVVPVYQSSYPVMADKNWNGLMNGQTFNYTLGLASNAPGNFSGATTYGYSYDDMNRLTVADADMLSNFSTPGDDLLRSKMGDVVYELDPIGNFEMLTRHRYEQSGNTTGTLYDAFSYTYQAGNNRLISVTNSMDNTLDRSYTYDGSGNVLSDDYRGMIESDYDRANLPTYIQMDHNEAITYGYDEGDQRFYKKVEEVGNNPQVLTKEYYLSSGSGKTLGRWDVANSEVEWYVHGAHRVAKHVPALGEQPVWLAADVQQATIPVNATSNNLSRTTNKGMPDSLTYYNYDYLGNTRVAYKAIEDNSSSTGFSYNIASLLDYYPYAKTLREYHSGEVEDYQSTGHERDKETGGLDYRGARYYDSEIGRFLSTDPLQAKFPNISTYVYAAANPIKYVDLDGRSPWDIKTEGDVTTITPGEGDNYNTFVAQFGQEFADKYWPAGAKVVSKIIITGYNPNDATPTAEEITPEVDEPSDPEEPIIKEQKEVVEETTEWVDKYSMVGYIRVRKLDHKPAIDEVQMNLDIPPHSSKTIYGKAKSVFTYRKKNFELNTSNNSDRIGELHILYFNTDNLEHRSDEVSELKKLFNEDVLGANNIYVLTGLKGPFDALKSNLILMGVGFDRIEVMDSEDIFITSENLKSWLNITGSGGTVWPIVTKEAVPRTIETTTKEEK